ncbi:adenylyltransferase/cytidyltransferase family protein [Maribacter antarcticus]|uniref:adenylyltransferase/cytidyltransferase family protein n=1 Tax=Maribacter antarcticus TaxID=505250 RepID=UPI0006847800|nr:adenylyltransferase/cytidyltransferase family protein [Maribacter antarcticus]
MIEVNDMELLNKFPGWKLVELTKRRIEMKSLSVINHNDSPKIVTYLFGKIPNTKWIFNLENDTFIAEIREKSKYTRMYTSGCFDIFHYGHLNILAKSKELCDYLIVGVSTDELIEKEKGRRPVIPFEERMKVMQAIGLVDEVIPQTDKDKQRIVDEHRIDAISVGSDWKGRYPKVSCAMEYFPYTANVSSTILKNTLQLK